MDLVYSLTCFMPLRLVLSGMKEVTRTFKLLTGINQAQTKYKDALMVMIAVAWARGQCWGRVCMCVRETLEMTLVLLVLLFLM